MKTIYLVYTKLGAAQAAMFAFECEECAKIQATLYRRDKIPVTVVPIMLYANIRAATMKECPHLKRPNAGMMLSHEHVPLVVNNV